MKGTADRDTLAGQVYPRPSGKLFSSPCQVACPAHINVQAYVSLVTQGRFDESLEVIRNTIPFPAICGRVCFAPCEEACYRNKVDEAVSIRLLKRLVSETEYYSNKLAKPVAIPVIHEEKIAIIGAGPTGLTAAYELVKNGYSVTLYERDQKPGGMIRSHIPRYRLPEKIVDDEVEYINGLGVNLKTGVEIGKDVSYEQLSINYSVVFVAVGAQKTYELNIPGEDLSGAFSAIEMMWDIHQGRKIQFTGKVAIVGGGNVAIDAARTALRLGAEEVIILYRRSVNEMPATQEEVKQALEEGIKYVELINPTRIIGDNGKVVAVECIHMTLGDPDESGRRRPVPIEGSEEILPFNSIISAIGQSIDLTFLPKKTNFNRWGTLEVSAQTLRSNIPGLFGGGDCVTGPSSVIEAIASGKKAAESIDQYLRNKDISELDESLYEEKTWQTEDTDIKLRPRTHPRYLNPRRRAKTFDEVEFSFSRTEGITEAQRCLQCGPCDMCLEKEGFCQLDKASVDKDSCSGCGTCITVCPYNAITKDDLSLAEVDEINCKGCGICASSCPDRAIEMKKLSDSCIIGEITGGAPQ
jgi:NADPH-dependent glutamate synthase beta subunit-like oxidoreductase/ferredoxin